MRALIISPLFPRRPDAEAFCGGKFVQGLIDAELEATVICSHNMRPAFKRDMSACWDALEAGIVDVPNPLLPLALRCWLGAKYQTTASTGWTAAVVAKAKELHYKRPFDLIVSRSHPWYAHVAGYWVASELGIPWIANFNDPWDPAPFLTRETARLAGKRGLDDNFWKRRVLSCATVVTFPCQRLRDYTLRGQHRRSQVHIVPHIGARLKPGEPSRDFVIVHAGTLHRDKGTGRRANAVIEGLLGLFEARPSARNRTRLVLVGEEDIRTTRYAAQLGVSHVVSCAGHVSYEASLRHIAEASICLLVESDVPVGVFLPSKLCDYIVARKPVLALSPAIGTVDDIAREGGIIRVDPNDWRGVSHALTSLFDGFAGGNLDAYAPPLSLAKRYESKAVIDEFLELVSGAARDGVRTRRAER